jgi:diketogulonate reductase-like aldo/keto reductase
MDVRTASIALNTGAHIPTVGLGVWQAPRGAATQEAVAAALRAGYRHVDTARVYGNEKDVGAAIAASGIPRSEIFVTTKLWNEDQGYDTALRAFDGSLERLGLDYIDLYLIHWPVPRLRLESWRALEKIFSDKRARAIGVSNFMTHHLDELLAKAKVVPAVDQFELSPFLQQRDARASCAKHGIVVEAYSPLTRAKKLGHPAIASIAKRIGKTPAQVMLRWGVQQGVVILPKSIHEERIVANAQLFDFELDAAAMRELDALDEGLATGWDPRDQA